MEIRLRVNVDSAWIIIRQPGQDPFYSDIAEAELPEVMAQYQAIQGDPERFRAFVSDILGRVSSSVSSQPVSERLILL